MRTLICAALCTVFSAGVTAAPTLIATADATSGNRTSVQFEFVADSANPTPSVMIELPLDAKAAKGVRLAENCFEAPMGFSALCNIDNTVFKAIIYTTNPNAALPSHVLGTVALPGLRTTETGEIEGLRLTFADSSTQSVVGEVLSQAPRKRNTKLHGDTVR
jgi:hypothetical protein